MKQHGITLCIWFLGCLGTSGFCREVPRVLHFRPEAYGAQAQNWSIAQRTDHQLFFGNSGGLLQFDGTQWQLHTLPSRQIVRVVAEDGEGRIYTGGYGSLGYWWAGTDGCLHFQEIRTPDPVVGQRLREEEIWHILPMGKERVLFQSFSTLFIYQGDTLSAVAPPGNIMFARQVNNRVILPVIGEGLYELLPDFRFRKLPGSEIFREATVSAILPLGASGMLVCTERNGIFKAADQGFDRWDCPAERQMTPLQVNKAILLRSGDYAFGTILDGLFIVSPDGRIIEHINQAAGLQNNTVLSLFEDRLSNLWVGLDRGIDLVALPSDMRFFLDPSGGLGTVYTAAVFRNNLYLGTNHGIFFRPYPASESDRFRLLPGSQGQVWDLQVFHDVLVAGHNSGTLLLSSDLPRFIYGNTGTYTTVAVPDRTDHLLQGTYTGIICLRRDSQGGWRHAHPVRGFFQSASKLVFDRSRRLWVLHPRKGLYRLTLDAQLQKVTEMTAIGPAHGLANDHQLDLVRIQGALLVRSGTRYLRWDESLNRFNPLDSIDGAPIPDVESRILEGQRGAWFFASTNRIRMGGAPGRQWPVQLVPGHERMVCLPDGQYLCCQEDGYTLLPDPGAAGLSDRSDRPLPPPAITAIRTGKGSDCLNDLSAVRRPLSFPPEDNRLKWYFTMPYFLFQPAMRHRMRGFDEEWSDFQPVHSREYTNLPPGDYVFEVQSELSPTIASLPFRILPRWYQTAWFRFAATALFLAGAFLLVRWHHRRLDTQKRTLDLEKARELEQQRIAARNELLQTEILNKNRKLADVTFSLIRKNEMLQGLRDRLAQARPEERNSPLLRQLSRLIDEHLGSEEDWELFESNFNQLHHAFFTRLKSAFPDMTPGDLRLAAYLKMNLSSKEIAPLLNISLRGVENKRYRLRTKLGLDASVNLTEYLMAY